MAYEMAVGLWVKDQGSYARYRKEMTPLLEAAGGSFRYDFEVAQTLKSPTGAAMNRVFVIQFPSKKTKEDFFADSRYRTMKDEFFAPAVDFRAVLMETSG
jgi:uncharacterized protein (DUF1330 family)